MMENEAHIKLTKITIRKDLRQRLKDLLQESRNDGQIVGKIRRLPQWECSRQIFAFIPLPSEPDITPLIDLGLEQGKQVLVPVCEENGIMHFTSLDRHWRESLKIGKHNILCPTDEGDRDYGETPLEELSPLILVPGLGYTKGCVRIGRGGGYYDRYLLTWGERLFKVGVCHSIQLLENIPVEPYDQLVDTVITD